MEGLAKSRLRRRGYGGGLRASAIFILEVSDTNLLEVSSETNNANLTGIPLEDNITILTEVAEINKSTLFEEEQILPSTSYLYPFEHSSTHLLLSL